MIRRAVRAAAALVWIALGWTAVGGAALAAQQGCSFIEGSGNLSTVNFGSGPVTYVSTPNLACRDGVRIRADSAVAYEASSYFELIGRVRFEDPLRRLTSNRAEYFTAAGRLQAHGAVEVVQKDDGGTIRGDELIFLRAGPGRARDQVDVFDGRPTARLYVKPRAAAPGPAAPSDTDPAPDSGSVPYDVTADRIVLEGDAYFRAVGQVEIRREALEAYGEQVEYDQVAGTLRITDRARMLMDGRELAAEEIQALLPDEEVSEVVARHRAVLTADQVRLEAPLVRVYMDDGAMQRLVAVPIRATRAEGELEPLPPPAEDTVRPVARAERFSIVADSLDVLTPAELLERIHAAGGARAESTARDSLNTADTPALARSDWMEGDTIVATFARADSAGAAPAADSSDEGGDYRLERLSAIGSARSLYRMAPRDTTRGCRGEPTIHYVKASRIVIALDDGEIDSMDVTGQTEGVHAEPEACSASDTTAAPDSLGVPAGDSAAADSTAVDGLGQSPGAGAPRFPGALPAERAFLPPAAIFAARARRRERGMRRPRRRGAAR